MKCRKYISLAMAAFCFGLWGCESDYVEPIQSISVEIQRVPSLSDSELSVIFKPNERAASFDYAIGDESDLEAFLAGTLAGIVKVVERGQKEVFFDNLTENTVYTIFARGYDSTGTAGPYASIKVKTRNLGGDLNVVREFLGERSVAFTITAEMTHFKYDFALGSASDREDFNDGSLKAIQSRSEFSEYTVNYYDLQPSNDYIFYVRAYDRQTGLPTEAMEIPVRTLDRGTAPAVSCTLGHIDLFRGNFIITPNEHCGKFAVAATLSGGFDVLLEEEMYWRGDVMKMLTSWESGNTGLVDVGYEGPFTASLDTGELVTDSDPFNQPIEVYILVFDEQEKPFAVQRFIFHSPQYDNNAGEAVVELKISHITTTGALYEFFPNDQTMGVFFETVDEEWYNQAMQSEYWYEGYMEDVIYHNGYWSYCHKYRALTYPERFGEPGKKYYVFWMPVNFNGPNDGFGKLNYQLYETLAE